MALDEAKDKTLEPTFSQKYLDFLRDIRSKTRIDQNDRMVWKQKMVISVNQRLGVKRYTNFPYPGAPDIPLPETDKLIKKSVPNLVLSAWSPKKLCRVRVAQGVMDTPELKVKAAKSEMAMNMFLRSPDMDWFRKLMLAADNRKQYGHAIFKVSEKFTCQANGKCIDVEDMDPMEVEMIKALPKADKISYFADKYGFDTEDKDDKKTLDYIVGQFSSGAKEIEFTVKEYKSRPMIDVVDPVTVTVPSYTKDINEAVRIREEFFLPRHIVEQLISDEIFLKKDLDLIPYWVNGDDDWVTVTKSRNEGITDNTSRTDLYRMELICCWYRENETDPFVRKIFTFFCDAMDPELALAQEIDFPFSFDGWAYEKDDNEIKDSRYYASRGVPEQIRAMQEIMERCINNKIIRDEMSNTPMWEVLDTSEIMDAHIRMTPGAKLPVRQLGAEIKQLSDYPKPDPNSTEIMTILKAYTEEYLAVSDQLFRNATNVGGGKTLGEINVGIQQNSGPLNLEVISWNETLSRVYTKMFQILAERLGESIYVDGVEVTKEDFNFPAEVRSNGDLEVANEQLATQKAAMRLQVIMNPVLQDIVNSEDRYNALKDWLEKDGVKDPDQFCTDPKIIAQEKINQMQQQLAQMAQQGQRMAMEGVKAEKDLQASKDQKKEVDAQAAQVKENSEMVEANTAAQVGKELIGGLFSG
jgi:hypothetical protein